MPGTLRGPDGRFAQMNERGQLVDRYNARRMAVGRQMGWDSSIRRYVPQRVHGYWTRNDDDWMLDNYDEGSYFIDNMWMHRPGDYDYTECAECGDWVHYDDAAYCYRDEVNYCRRHEHLAQPEHYYDEDDDYYDNEGDYDDPDYDGPVPSRPVRCDVCDSTEHAITHHDPITDRIACERCVLMRPTFYANSAERFEVTRYVPIPTFTLVAA